MNLKILNELEELKRQTDFIINNKEIIENKNIEKYLRCLEKTRYEIFEKIKFENNEETEEQEKIHCINNSYKANVKQGILKIFIPEVLPKYKRISNFAYKNILMNTAEAIKEYRDLFKDKLTFVIIIIHEKQSNMDIDNKYVKPIIDALVLQGVIKDDNINNMFYLTLGKSDTKRPYTEVFAMTGEYILSWLEKIQKIF